VNVAVRAMPDFTLAAYRELLRDLTGAGYALAPVTAMAEPAPGRVAYLRHDIDLHVPGVERMAQAEAEAGARSTYYVMVSQHYNPFYPPNRAILREVADLGHELGLHYDLVDYPADPVAARRRLDAEVAMVGELAGRPVTTISMHQPGLSGVDPYRETDAYVHPHDPRLGEGLLYVSDSCRAWRDETLLGCFGPQPPARLLLLTHPETWLGPAGTVRTVFLDDHLTPAAVEQHRQFFDVTVRRLWATHAGPALHDAREAAARAQQ
jgi:hypothetical protein